MDYRPVKGPPLRDHLGEIRLSPIVKGGTTVRYRIRFGMPWWAGGDLTARLVANRLKTVIAAAYRRLADELR
jgi:hypothetical protein